MYQAQVGEAMAAGARLAESDSRLLMSASRTSSSTKIWSMTASVGSAKGQSMQSPMQSDVSMNIPLVFSSCHILCLGTYSQGY